MKMSRQPTVLTHLSILDVNYNSNFLGVGVNGRCSFIFGTSYRHLFSFSLFLSFFLSFHRFFYSWLISTSFLTFLTPRYFSKFYSVFSPCSTHGFIFSLAFDRSINVAILDERGVAELDGDVLSDLLVLDEAILFVVFFTFLFLLWLIVGCIGCVTFLVVAMVKKFIFLNSVIVHCGESQPIYFLKRREQIHKSVIK